MHRVTLALALAFLLYPTAASAQNEAKELGLFETLRLAYQSTQLMEEGTRLYQQGKVKEAAAVFRKAADTFERMSEGKQNSPRIMSHTIRAQATSLLGELERVIVEYQAGLEVARRVHAGRDHNELALCLEGLAGALAEAGRPADAVPLADEAMAIRRRMTPDPNNPKLVHAHQTMGELLMSLGEFEKALPHVEATLRMNKKLARGKDDPVYAESLANLGVLLGHLGQWESGLSRLEEALAMQRRLANDNGDSMDVAIALFNSAHLYRKQGNADQGRRQCQESVVMLERMLDGKDHRYLAMALINLAAMLQATGDAEAAIRTHDRALAMTERLFSRGDHPLRMTTLHGRGALLHELGRDAEALPHFEKSLAMFLRLTESLAAGASETGLLQFTSTSVIRNDYLTVTRPHPELSAQAYQQVWRTKAVLTRLLQRRADATRVALGRDAAVRDKWIALQTTRRELTHILLSAKGEIENRDEQLRELTDRKERLQLELAERLPGSRPDASAGGPEELVAHLPAGSAFVDLLHYDDTSNVPVARYCAFVLAPEAEIARVDLGLAKTIDAAVNDWRSSLDASPEATAQRALKLRRLVWDPIESHLPKSTRTVFLAPDGDLNRAAFPALPDREPGTVLLERFAFACVMHGPHLLEQLRRSQDESMEAGTVLALGGVEYGKPPEEATERYEFLNGAERERKQVLAIAGDRPSKTLTGKEATVTAAVDHLPKVRYAHLATHGFFAAGRLENERQRFAEHLQQQRGTPTHGRVGLGGRNPLGYVGLVMADGDVLSGETVAGLDLSRMELAVLSACETGLGRRTDGEGVYGLQRAFHLAGCENVVASLWKVNDQATAALMAKFYHGLWVEKKPAIEALRQAQLLIYRRPDLIPDLAGSRGAIRVEAAIDAKPTTQLGPAPRRTPARLWAGFVLSGSGR